MGLDLKDDGPDPPDMRKPVHIMGLVNYKKVPGPVRRMVLTSPHNGTGFLLEIG